MRQRAVSQITVLDTGGQYTHLIARRVRELGVYADVQPSDTPAEQLRTRKGIIISGGPCSVYEAGSPDIDPHILGCGIPVLGICYGHQLLAHHLGGNGSERRARRIRHCPSLDDSEPMHCGAEWSNRRSG